MIFDAHGNPYGPVKTLGFRGEPSSLDEDCDISLPESRAKLPTWVSDEGHDQPVAAKR